MSAQDTPPAKTPPPEMSMAQQAIVMNEMYQSLADAGFTEDQALKLVAYMVVIQNNDPDALPQFPTDQQ